MEDDFARGVPDERQAENGPLFLALKKCATELEDSATRDSIKLDRGLGAAGPEDVR